MFSKSIIGLGLSQQWPELLPQPDGLPGIRYTGNNKYPGGAKRLDQFTGIFNRINRLVSMIPEIMAQAENYFTGCRLKCGPVRILRHGQVETLFTFFVESHAGINLLLRIFASCAVL